MRALTRDLAEDDEAGEQRAMVGALMHVELVEEVRALRQVLAALLRAFTS